MIVIATLVLITVVSQIVVMASTDYQLEWDRAVQNLNGVNEEIADLQLQLDMKLKELEAHNQNLCAVEKEWCKEKLKGDYEQDTFVRCSEKIIADCGF